MPGTQIANTGEIRWYNSSVPQRSFVHAFQQGSPSTPTAAEYFSQNHAGQGPAYINAAGVAYYINRNDDPIGRAWHYDVYSTSRVQWDLAHSYSQWPNTQQYSVDIMNNTANDYEVRFYIDDGFAGWTPYLVTQVGPSTSPMFNQALLAASISFPHTLPNVKFNLAVIIIDLSGMMPGNADIVIEDSDGYGTMYMLPGNFIPPGGSWDNFGTPADLNYYAAHSYYININ